LARAPVLEPLTGTATSNFDATKLTWIGSGMTEFTVCAFLGNPRIQTFADIARVPSTMASSGPGSDDDMISKVLIKLFDLKARIVTGYPGGAEMLLAVDRGEVDGRCGWSFTSIKQARPEWITEHKLRFLASVSLERWPELPDVPSIMEFATTEKQRQILSFVISIGALGRPFIAPPGIPPERAAALRTAFAKAIQDPDYVAETIARKETPLLVDGAGAARIIKDLFSMPKEVTAETKAMIASNAGAQ
jgi:tripartite-type tricarboxylate transporter receptor subunit TctC